MLRAFFMVSNVFILLIPKNTVTDLMIGSSI
jgi:hypothetical protein